jgi:hypothetical protein
MLIPNKHSGYRRDGTRNLYVGGGVGEAALLQAMLTGAAVGGGSSILQGKDPLQGAVLGGLLGGAGSGISSAFGAATPAATETAAAALPTAATTPGIPPGFESFAPTGTQFGAMGEAPLGQSFDSFGNPATVGSPAATMADPTGLAQQQMSLNAAQAPTNKGIFDRAGQFFSELTPTQQLLAGGTGIAGLGMISDQMRGGTPEEKPYGGALSRFKYDPDKYNPYKNEAANIYRPYGYADGGIASLGGYSDGGRMLKGPGDGMSDSIPAKIGSKQPARLADGEFVVPADVVSHLGNGSTDAGAKQLYSMMNKVRKARTGNPKQGRQINPSRYLA